MMRLKPGLAGFFTILVLVLALFNWFAYNPGDTNDDTAYLSMARSLAQGEPCLSLALAGAPAHQRFPPGYPLLLTPLQWFVPSNYALCRIESLLFALLAGWLFCAYNRRLHNNQWLPLLFLVNPFWTLHSTQIMSEPPFIAGIFAYLLSLEKRLESPGHSSFRWFALGVYLGALCALRSFAIVLIPVLFAGTVWKRGWKPALTLGLGVAMTAGPWLLRSLLTGYDQELAISKGPWETFTSNFSYFPPWAGWLLLIEPRWVPSWLPLWLGWLPLGLALIGLRRMIDRPWLFGWVVLGLGLLLNWPYQFPRLLLPLLPFLQLGLWHQLNLKSKRSTRWLFATLVAVNLLTYLLSGFPLERKRDTEAVKALRSLPAAAVLATQDMSWWLWTQHPCAANHKGAIGDEGKWLDSLVSDEVRMVVVDEVQETEGKAISLSLSRRGWLYQLVYRSPQTELWEFRPDAAWRRSWRFQQLARMALKDRHYSVASKLFRRALREAPYDIAAASGLCFALAAQDEGENARRLADQVLAVDPDCKEAALVRRLLSR